MKFKQNNTMITKKILYAGQPGTKKWVKKYGKNLIAVRYKYDAFKNQKMITVELLADKKSWQKNENKIPKNKIVKIKINYGEVDLGRKVKSFGAKWDKKEKLWKMRYDVVQALGLEDRLVREKDKFPNIGKNKSRDST